ncbi:MAG: hypothetical protein DYG89_24910 [Caldilinea sp. CFX5]|nr:hypothetical protein [Caldilinea sp. CFX5]
MGKLVWGLGIAFSLVFILVIWLAGGRLEKLALLPDQGATWYYWQLPAPTRWSQMTAWGGYLLHQLFLWGTIFYARRQALRYTAGVHPINVIALLGNAAFVALHFVQTQIWYDGLAQDVPLWSSEASVVLLLVVVLLLENRRRGLFFGKKAPLAATVTDFCRRYHGYFFAWAVVYTFWFHPMVATSGHLIGFFYVFLLLLQGSLFYTRLHLNRWWTFTLEALVLLHGAVVVAMLRGSGVWAFVLGFLGLFLVTQMYGLPLKRWLRWGAGLLYVGVVWVAWSQRGVVVVRDLVLIPGIEYGLVLILAALIGTGIAVRRWLRQLAVAPASR